jgi:hypothetical protein
VDRNPAPEQTREEFWLRIVLGVAGFVLGAYFVTGEGSSAYLRLPAAFLAGFAILAITSAFWTRRPRRRLFRTKQESASYQFDAQLSSLINEFNDVLRIGSETRPEGAAREKLKARAEDVAARTEALSPPDAEWQEVLEDYVWLEAIHLEHFGEVLPIDVQRHFAGISQRATRRREELRERYRGEA